MVVCYIKNTKFRLTKQAPQCEVFAKKVYCFSASYHLYFQ